MTEKEKIMSYIKTTKTVYDIHAKSGRKRLSENIKSGYTGQQLQSDLMYIQDMESRAYAIKLLIEELEEGYYE